MLTKSLIASAVLSLAVAFPVAGAEAKSNVNLNIGVGLGGYYGPGYDPGYYGGIGFEAEYGGVSCAKARKIVRGNGFHKVVATDCSAPNYQFTAWRYGSKYRVRVNSWGDITGVKPL